MQSMVGIHPEYVHCHWTHQRFAPFDPSMFQCAEAATVLKGFLCRQVLKQVPLAALELFPGRVLKPNAANFDKFDIRQITHTVLSVYKYSLYITSMLHPKEIEIQPTGKVTFKSFLCCALQCRHPAS